MRDRGRTIDLALEHGHAGVSSANMMTNGKPITPIQTTTGPIHSGRCSSGATVEVTWVTTQPSAR